MLTTNTTAELFRHLSAEKAVLYRSVMDVFAAAKRQYRLQLRPDEVLTEGNWSGSRWAWDGRAKRREDDPDRRFPTQ